MKLISDNIKKKFKEAEIFFSNKDYERTISVYNDILKENPNFVAALNNIAQAYEYLKNLKEAENNYKKCVLLKPNEIIFMNNLSNIYMKQNNFNQALPLLEKSFKKNQNQIKIIHSIIMCLTSLEMREKAEQFSIQVLEIFPNDRLINNLRGKNLINLNKHQEGLNCLKKGTGFIEFNDKKINLTTH
jgi:tetratricopeptide (TPR) repeat protein